MLNELIQSRQWFNRHLFHAGRRLSHVGYTVVHLFTHDCTGGLLTRYPTVDSVVATGSTCASNTWNKSGVKLGRLFYRFH